MPDGKIVQVYEDGLVFEVTTLGVNIKHKSHVDEPTAWVTLTTPDVKPIMVGIGDRDFGPGVLTLEQLQDTLRKLYLSVDGSFYQKGDF